MGFCYSEALAFSEEEATAYLEEYGEIMTGGGKEKTRRYVVRPDGRKKR